MVPQGPATILSLILIISSSDDIWPHHSHALLVDLKVACSPHFCLLLSVQIQFGTVNQLNLEALFSLVCQYLANFGSWLSLFLHRLNGLSYNFNTCLCFFHFLENNFCCRQETSKLSEFRLKIGKAWLRISNSSCLYF